MANSKYVLASTAPPSKYSSPLVSYTLCAIALARNPERISRKTASSKMNI